jgi:hypothetical protein
MRPPRDTLTPKRADIHVRIPIAAGERLKAMAEARDIPISVLARWLVLEGLRGLEEAS